MLDPFLDDEVLAFSPVLLLLRRDFLCSLVSSCLDDDDDDDGFLSDVPFLLLEESLDRLDFRADLRREPGLPSTNSN